MPLDIKVSTVDELAEQVRVQLGARTKTDAVRTALRHEQERGEAEVPLRQKFAAIRKELRNELGPPPRDLDMKKIMDDLWEHGA
ncbi:MAG: type II toxin-antitoxin system VapB family antitoxin [Rhizobiaceae bacterium]|nr:type II toxin-antitoxin system VapB family antitoxin [Rhizobiaceae bacterium]